MLGFFIISPSSPYLIDKWGLTPYKRMRCKYEKSTQKMDKSKTGNMSNMRCKSMDTIIEAINELRQKLLIKKSQQDIAILKRLEGYLEEAQYYMRLAKRTVDEHNIEL